MNEREKKYPVLSSARIFWHFRYNEFDFQKWNKFIKLWFKAVPTVRVQSASRGNFCSEC
mgnify:CR=1 FL=1